MKPLVVMKFGGTSVGDGDRIVSVAKIVSRASKHYRVVVVTSAMSGVTDMLIQAAENAEAKSKRRYIAVVEKIRQKHLEAAKSLQLAEKAEVELLQTIEQEMLELRSWLEGVFALSELTPRARDLITSFGERLNIKLVSAAIALQGIHSVPITADRCIITDATFTDAQPDLQASSRRSKAVLFPLLETETVPVVTGFMGATSKGIITTLGRGGSDYSATILGNCIDADEVWIWTDVTGVMTADPRIISTAKTVRSLSYNEAAELSYFGAKVLHPLTMVPAALKDIPIVIKNTMEPTAEGTIISGKSAHNAHGIKAVTSMKQLSLITVQGKGMTGVPGIAAKVFDAIAAASISVLFISQASSEYNISLVVKHVDGKRAVEVLRGAFAAEVRKHSVDLVRLREHLAIIAVVGEEMHGQPGVSGKTLASIGDASINVVAIAQGSSERNISLVIAEEDVASAVDNIHKAFDLGKG